MEKETNNYDVVFSYTISVNAKDETEALNRATNIWDEIMPRTDEMNVNIIKDNNAVENDDDIVDE